MLFSTNSQTSWELELRSAWLKFFLDWNICCLGFLHIHPCPFHIYWPSSASFHSPPFPYQVSPWQESDGETRSEWSSLRKIRKSTCMTLSGPLFTSAQLKQICAGSCHCTLGNLCPWLLIVFPVPTQHAQPLSPSFSQNLVRVLFSFPEISTIWCPEKASPVSTWWYLFSS